jgi:hypothetical protein
LPNSSSYQSDIYAHDVATSDEVPFSDEMFFEVPSEEEAHPYDLKHEQFSEGFNSNFTTYQPKKGKSKYN